MIEAIFKGISKIFGNKSERDIKELLPRVERINKHFESYKNLSNDELRAKTAEFRQRIADYLSDIIEEMSELKNKVDSEPDMAPDEKQDIYDSLDRLKKERNKKLEEVLDQILEEAFAVVKDTARRLTENSELTVSASDFDRDLAARKAFVRIEGDKAIWKNNWDAAGNEVTWNMVHYDVQLIGGMVLHHGKIAEMATGEGKTLVSTLPAYLNALSGYGVHLVTVNDYLARRDCEWNGPLFQFHGISVDCLDYHQPNSAERRQAYRADITYGTNNEFGFDYLRDNMARDVEDLVQREHHYTMVDEVDSVLVDDARTPLIISGPIPKGDQHEFTALKPRVKTLVDAQKSYINTALSDAKKLIAAGNDKEGGKLLYRVYRGLPKHNPLIKFLGETGNKAVMQKAENIYLADNQKLMPQIDEELYFVIDEKNNSIELTEKGIELITANGEDPNFFVMPDVGSEIAEIENLELADDEKLKRKDTLMQDFSVKSERIHSINQLLKAYCMFERDVDYIISPDGKIKIVDEQTGRVLDGRRYSDGLHQAIEAKENVKVEAATQTFATITLQNYFRMYHKIAGMTGTAETEAGELWEIYKLDVVVIPTNRPIIRKDENDLVFKTKREKYNAVIDEVVKLSEAGRPVLVGTTSVEVSELLARMLQLRKIKHNVLNAKQHQREAEVVAEAGQAGAVTIATNMAGRGTDIKLGEGVKEKGGLAIVGTERHESRRVDRQLRGRAGRQGDPGSSIFFVSLEDDLMRLFGSDRISKVMDRFGHQEGEVIQHGMISRSIENAQKKVEQNNFGIRKRLLEYDDVMNSQREVVYNKRRNALFGDKLNIDLNNMLYSFCEQLVSEYQAAADFEGFKLELLRHLAAETQMNKEEFLAGKSDVIAEKLFFEMNGVYRQRSQFISETALPVLTDILNTRGETVTNIAVPFTDGMRGMQVVANLKKSVETGGRELISAFQRNITLAVIDDEWKEHLREMDDLKRSVQNAHLEQKDPLLIYKLESFKLFQNMVNRLNEETLSMMFKGHIMTDDGSRVQENAPAAQPKEDLSKLQTSREDDLNQATPEVDDRPKTQPMKAELKVGRNEPCPCGSGKKFKNCHGAGMV
ncbi:MAG: preprotein translocase subunit SecA [Bacteroidetes bacterium]|nr:MAG: preprotein translocase subunit SecA [Bacteroidota bacterium]